ncbi:hypothetical protein ABT160_04175 [Streptomyces sp. NPDC001941]|uniref:hypothetical protein n=1 Tax=Streptomyces sp. NPDC001941 TaxID=3154659 RepID=UPI0033218B20
MNPHRTLLLTALLALALLCSAVGAAAAGLLARWDGATLPAALARAGVAFGGSLTVCCALIALLLGGLS